MKENIIQKKSFEFAIRVVKLCKFLRNNGKEYVLSKQLLRSGTSIGANVEEAIGGQSRGDFVAKLSIAYKEARETGYWIKLLKETGYLSFEQYNSLFTDIDEIVRIIGKIQKTVRSNS